MKAIDRKMLRDLRGMRGQAVAIAFVIVSGVATYVTMTATMDTLQQTLATYYADYRFADVFAPVRRAPERLAAQLRRVPGEMHGEDRARPEVVPGPQKDPDDELYILKMSCSCNRLTFQGNLPHAKRKLRANVT